MSARKNILEYKGYLAHYWLDLEENLLVGRTIGMRDIVSFEGKTPSELVADFRAGVDDYLEHCRKKGIEPDKPYSGVIYIRTEPEVHKELDAIAAAAGESINSIGSRLLRDFVKRRRTKHRSARSSA